jgi:hypothetical protein
VKLHALPLSPPPPPLPAPPSRALTPAETAVLPFQPKPAVNAVQATAIRRSPTETRGNTATQTKQTASRVATPILDASDTRNSQAPYRRGALVDISA